MTPKSPTPAERRKESAILWPLLADGVLTVLLVGFGVLTASLTLLSEGIRSGVTMAAQIYGFTVLRAIHRSRLGHFEFGVGKIEQFVGIVVGAALIASALFVLRSAVLAVIGPTEVATPFGLAVAAVINAVNALLNLLAFVAVLGASGAGDSRVYRTQLAARAVMLLSSLTLLVTLTAAALARDPAIALLLDIAGALFVALLMLVNGLTMLRRALPEILDAPPPAATRERLAALVAHHLPPGACLDIRARHAGGGLLAEIALGPTSPAGLSPHRARLTAALAEAGLPAEIALVHRAAATQSPPTSSER